jgi:hypothetical protein
MVPSRRCCFATFVVVALASVVFAALPAAAAKGGVITRSVKVLDATGHPFLAGTAGVAACPLEKVPCAPSSPGLIRAPADANGNVAITMTANMRYHFVGYLVCGPSTTTSNPFDGLGAQLENGTRFAVNATCAEYDFDVFVHYLGGSQAPLPAGRGGVLACANGGGCAVGAPDANGHATIALDPTLSYTINGMAVDMPGWKCGLALGGSHYWFSATSVTGTPDAADGSQFVVNQPSCYEFHAFVQYLDGTVAPVPAAYGGVLACPTSGTCATGTADATGHVTMNLDPSVSYTINAYMANVPGWACPGYSAGGNNFWFSKESVTGTPNLADGTTFGISQPNPASCVLP